MDSYQHHHEWCRCLYQYQVGQYQFEFMTIRQGIIVSSSESTPLSQSPSASVSNGTLVLSKNQIDKFAHQHLRNLSLSSSGSPASHNWSPSVSKPSLKLFCCANTAQSSQVSKSISVHLKGFNSWLSSM